MKRPNYLQIIENAFADMEQRKEDSIIVRLFENLNWITLPSGGIMQAHFAKIILYRNDDTCKIKILYRENDVHEILPFMTHEEKVIAVNMLVWNEIMPTPEEWQEAKSLLNSPDMAVDIAGCDYENAVTENAKAYLEKQGNPS